MQHEQDEAAAERFRNGDPAGLQELYERYSDVVYGYLSFLTWDETLRDDVFQDTWVRLAGSIRKRGAPRNFRAYAVTTARNLFRDRMRDRKRNTGLFLPAGQPPLGNEPPHQIPDSSPGPREKLEETRLTERLAREVLRLPSKEREVLVMRLETGLTFREIARILGRPIGTVLARMHRATERLRRNLGDIE